MIGHPNLKLWLPLSENTGTPPVNIIDSSNSSLIGTPTSFAGVIGKSLYFATNQRVIVGNPSYLNVGAGDWTLACWFKRNSLSGTGPKPIFNKDIISAGNRQFFLNLDGEETNSNKILVGGFIGTTFVYGVETASTTNNTTSWFHVAAGISNSSFFIHVNGVESSINRVGTPGILNNSPANLEIGGRNYDGAACNAYISHPMFFNYALNSNDTKRIMQVFHPLSRS